MGTSRMAKRLAGRFGYPKHNPFAPRWRPDRFDEVQPTQRPRVIFVPSMGDLFHPLLYNSSGAFKLRQVGYSACSNLTRILDTMRRCPQHVFLVLTKRPRIMRDLVPRLMGLLNHGIPLRNVWLGVSIENQRRADERQKYLRGLSALGWRTFVSYEPALGPIDWRGWEFIDWLIAGGESGRGARPAHPDWFRTARDWCASHQIPFFFKQWGEWGISPRIGKVLRSGATRTPAECRDPDCMLGDPMRESTTWCWYRLGKKTAGRLLDGREWNQLPPQIAEISNRQSSIVNRQSKGTDAAPAPPTT